mmetsp:Transcript_112858/g.224587  ORF Transcript_112858/g.224587 Transcript_112858/m.224587 type:complete len:88 (-) Transcript_112858:826-1089(-)
MPASQPPGRHSLARADWSGCSMLICLYLAMQELVAMGIDMGCGARAIFALPRTSIAHVMPRQCLQDVRQQLKQGCGPSNDMTFWNYL